MAEKVVSPGVFTNEIDLSFLPAGIGEIGAVVIGPTKKGPAFWPTIIESFGDFTTKFGNVSSTTYVPYTIQEYLKSAGRVTIIRTLGNETFTEAHGVRTLSLGTSVSAAAASMSIELNNGSVADGDFVAIHNGTKLYYFIGRTSPGFDQDPYYFFKGSGTDEAFVASASVQINSILGSSGTNQVEASASYNASKGKLTLTALTAGTAGENFYAVTGSTTDGETFSAFSLANTTIGGTTQTLTGYDGVQPAGRYLDGGVDASGGKVAAILVPKQGVTISNSTYDWSVQGTGDAFSITEAGNDYTVSASFTTGSENYIENVFGRDPFATSGGTDIGKRYYLYKFFPRYGVANNSETVNAGNADTVTFSNRKSYSRAYTPWIRSQNLSGTTYQLFRCATLSDGVNSNYNVKVQIQDIKRAGTIAGSDYGEFTLVIRRVNGNNYFDGDWGSEDLDSRQQIVETYNKLNFDPESTNFILRRIGDRYVSSISDDGKITYTGDWPNKSKYIYIDWKGTVDIENLPKEVLPFGFEKLQALNNSTTPQLKLVTYQGTKDTYNAKVPLGFDFTDTDNKEYLWAVDDNGINTQNTFQHLGTTFTGTAGDGHFNLDDFFVHASASSAAGTSMSSSTAPAGALKFIVPFQQGHEGIGYNVKRNVGSDITAANLYGMDLSSATAGGTKAYYKALNTISNQDEWDINMIITPGVLHSLHPLVTAKAIQVCEDRGDAFYLLDAVERGKTVDNTATSAITTIDSNYAATYWPWVKIIDTSVNKPTWVPASVVLAGAISYNDKVAHEWFAPAGLNRGGLTTVLEAEQRLTHAERDTLYEARINPIASFPGEGVVVWGQKTLQGKPSALDRVNVRRLLIRCKKFIASASRFLVFEQNNAALRTRFLNIANPFLEKVQQQSGLSAFKVVMDDSNNTPDLIDRNVLYGQIFLQPTRTAEFIVLDFNVMPTGATFPE